MEGESWGIIAKLSSELIRRNSVIQWRWQRAVVMEMRYLGEIDATEAATSKRAAKYDDLTFRYEAGPTGYGLYRPRPRLHRGGSVATLRNAAIE
jgi:hypothetical protein